MSLEVLSAPEVGEQNFPRYLLTSEQLYELPEAAAVAYLLETDPQLQEFTQGSGTVSDRLMQLTGYDHETIVKANKFLSSENAHKAKYAEVERDEEGRSRFILTKRGRKYLDDEVIRVGGVIFDN